MMSVALQNRLLLKAVQARYGVALPLPLLLPIVTLCNYTLLSATVKVLETFLEAILCKPFKLVRCILNVRSFTKATSQCCFYSSEDVNVSCIIIQNIF